MPKNLLKYDLVSKFEEEQGAGGVVTSIVPGVAYILENQEVVYNETEPDTGSTTGSTTESGSTAFE